MEHDVFISYSSRDKAIADAVTHTLEQHGIRCWIAPRDVRAGVPYAREIMEGIRGCRMMVLVFTANANRSEHVSNEVDKAFNEGKTIIPFLVDKTPMSDELDYYLSRKHWLVAYPDYRAKCEELVGAVLGILGSSPVSPPPPEPVRLSAGWMVCSIVMCLFCPLAGIYAVLQASELRHSVEAGERQLAERYKRRIRICGWITVAFMVIYVAAVLLSES